MPATTTKWVRRSPLKCSHCGRIAESAVSLGSHMYWAHGIQGTAKTSKAGKAKTQAKAQARASRANGKPAKRVPAYTFYGNPERGNTTPSLAEAIAVLEVEASVLNSVIQKLRQLQGEK